MGDEIPSLRQKPTEKWEGGIPELLWRINDESIGSTLGNLINEDSSLPPFSGTSFKWHLELDGDGNNGFLKFGGTCILPLSCTGGMIVVSGGKFE
jgi:hypothetical protein